MERANIQRVENQDTNYKLNAYMHSKLKEQIGLRNYLRHIQRVCFITSDKNILSVICENREKL